MLEKGAKKKEIHCKDQVCQASVPSNKEGWRATTSDQPEKIQHIHILQTFQDGRTPSIKGNFGTRRLSMDLKDAYFCVPLNKQSREHVPFEWEGFLYELLCLCFGLGPASSLFTKLIKLPVSILRKLYIRIIAYLDDFLILGKTLEEAILSRDTVIYLLQNLGFVIN